MIEKINKVNNFLSSKMMVYLDYLGALAFIAWGVYRYQNGENYEFILGFGIVALIFAVIKPAKYLNRDKKENKSKK